MNVFGSDHLRIICDGVGEYYAYFEPQTTEKLQAIGSISLVGVALFVASGAVIIDRWQHYGKSDIRDKNLAKASLSIINGAVLLIDAILTQRGG